MGDEPICEETQTGADIDALESALISTRHEGRTITTLCDRCWYIFDHIHELPFGKEIYSFPYFHKFSSVKVQARNGCLFCRQYIRMIENRWGQFDYDIRFGCTEVHTKLSTERDLKYWPLSAATLYLSCESMKIIETTAFEDWGSLEPEGKIAIGKKTFKISATLDEQMDQDEAELTKTVCIVFVRSLRWDFSGLLLKSTVRQPGEYVRLGLFNCSHPERTWGMPKGVRDPPPEGSYASISQEVGVLPTYNISII